MRVALVHEWLTNIAGSERVLLALHELYPEAPVHTSVFVPEEFPQLEDADVRTSFLQKIPGARTRHQAFPLLRTVAFERFDLSAFDVVISSSHAEAKGVITPPETLHICYCYTPIRYYWSGYHHYLQNPRFGVLNPIVKAVMPYMTNYLRVWDRCAADRVDLFVAISDHVAKRIKKYYRRDADVIYPPVNTSWLDISSSVDEYFLLVGRLIPYKRADIVVEAFNRLGLPLKVAGTGSELDALRGMAGPNVEFLGRVPDAELRELYSRCRALVFPQEEDFGIVPLEAMAAGRPVIAYRAGGALETVVEGETGMFFDRQDAQSLMECVRDFDPGRFNPERARERALRFDVEVFKEQIKNYVADAWERFADYPATLTKVGRLMSMPTPDTKAEGEHGKTADEKRIV
ncbi:MAG: glycosyltransferase family 4 protein [Actinobacteria bacterium]|nr:MAG: glycosyltransferase family 4 protein [Actinomycetota bacterium]